MLSQPRFRKALEEVLPEKALAAGDRDAFVFHDFMIAVSL